MLDQAKIFADNKVVHIDEQVLRRLAIQQPIELARDKWILCFGNRSCKREAQTVCNDFKKACRQLNVRVEDPFLMELDDESNERELEQRLLNYMMEC